MVSSPEWKLEVGRISKLLTSLLTVLLCVLLLEISPLEFGFGDVKDCT